MAKQPPKTGGIFGIDLIPGVDIQDILPGLTKPVTDAIKDTVGILVGPDGPNIGDPQPAGPPPIPVEAGSEELSAAVKAIDAAISALNFVLKLGFIIPDAYEAPLRALVGALTTIRGWLD